jgi:uncharacterized membrane protein
MYETLKLIHILSSVLMVGTGFGSAFYMFMANRSKNLQAQLIVTRLVVKADWWFTTPTIIIQPVSGWAMAYLAGWPLNASWLLWTYGLYALAAFCWLPVVWLQLQMRNMATLAAQNSTPLPSLFWRYAGYWEKLGYPAFIAMLLIYWLMVNKPS